MSKSTDERLHKLFADLKNNDSNALEKIYNENKRIIYRIAFSILKNSNDADDVVQNVIYKIFKANKESLPSSKELSWIYSITRNEAYSFYKIKYKYSNINDIYTIKMSENTINKIDSNIYFNEIIKKLNPIDQQIVSMKVISDFSFKTISKLLNMPIGTVEWRYYKSIKYLKNSILLIIISIISINLLNRNYNKSKTKQSVLEENIAKKEEYNKIDKSNAIVGEEYLDYEIDDTFISDIEQKKEKCEMIIENTNKEIQQLQTTNIITGLFFILCVCSMIIQIIKYKKFKKIK